MTRGRRRKPAARGQSGAAFHFRRPSARRPRCTRPARRALTAPARPPAPRPRPPPAPERAQPAPHLQQQLDPLDRGHGRLGDGGGDASGQEVLGEGDGLLRHGGGAAGGQRSAGAESRRVGAAGSALPPPGPKRRGGQRAAAKGPTPRPAPPPAAPIGCAAPPRAAGSLAAPRSAPASAAPIGRFLPRPRPFPRATPRGMAGAGPRPCAVGAGGLGRHRDLVKVTAGPGRTPRTEEAGRRRVPEPRVFPSRWKGLAPVTSEVRVSPPGSPRRPPTPSPWPIALTDAR